MPKISIIIPAYNVEEYIERSIQSVLNQTLSDIQVLVINDGSKDGTLNKIMNLAKVDSRLTVINSKNQGVSRARNIGIEHAKGDYLYFLDSDDWIERCALEKMFKLAEEKKVDVLIIDAFKDFERKSQLFKDGHVLTGEHIKDLLLGNIKPCIWTKLYKTEVIKDNNIIFNESVRIGEDLLFNFEVFSNTHQIYNLNIPLIHYVIRKNSTSNTYDEKVMDIFIVLEAIKKILNSNGDYKKYKEEYKFLKFLHEYYFRVVMSNDFGRLHEMMYYRWEKSKNKYLNDYCTSYISHERFDNKILFYFYSTNYKVGVYFKKFKHYVFKIGRSQ